jgi:hypothetical protein
MALVRMRTRPESWNLARACYALTDFMSNARKFVLNASSLTL